MRIITKRLILSAVKKLYIAYKENTIKHTVLNCVLCNIYLKRHEYDVCTTCLNTSFINNRSGAKKCVIRGDIYTSLDYRIAENNINLYHFWKEVYDTLKTLEEYEIVSLNSSIKNIIIKIAEEHNNKNLSIKKITL